MGVYTGRQFKNLTEKGIDQSVKAARAGGRLASETASYARDTAAQGLEYAIQASYFRDISPAMRATLKLMKERNDEDMRKLVEYARQRIKKEKQILSDNIKEVNNIKTGERNGRS